MIQDDYATLLDKVAKERKIILSVIAKGSLLIRFIENQFMLINYTELYIKPEVKLSLY